MARIAVVGAGAWGTALAVVAYRAGHEVTLWGRDPEAIARIASQRENAGRPAGDHSARRRAADAIARRAGRGGVPARGGAGAGAAVAWSGRCPPRTRRW